MQRWEHFILKILGTNKKIFCFSLIFGLVFTANFCIWGKDYSDKIQNDIANEVIRLHVLANSDTNFDQALKLKVRDEVLKNMSTKLNNAKNKSQTRKILNDNLEQIKQIALHTVVDNGYDYDVKVLLSNDNFPTKKYADLTLPSGNYESLKIIIGKGQGHNWWCVMFPPLCFVDVTKKTVPDNLKQDLKDALTNEEFKIVNCENEKNLSVKVKFKIVEAWQKFEMKNKSAKNSVKGAIL